MKIYTVSEEYLANNPLYQDTYHSILNGITRSNYDKLERVFVFELLGGQHTLTSMNSKKTQTLSVDNSFWERHYETLKQRFITSASVHELKCFVSVIKDRLWVKFSQYLPSDSKFRFIPDIIIDYESVVILNDVNRKRLSIKFSGNRLDTLIEKYYREQSLSSELQMISSHYTPLQDENGISKFNISSIIAPTRNLNHLYVKIKDCIYPENLNGFDCRMLSKVDPLFKKITDINTCLRCIIGNYTFETPLPFALDKHPLPGQVTTFAKKDYYGFTNEDIKALVSNMYF